MAASDSHIEIGTLAGGVTRVRLAGDIDLSIAPQVEQALEQLVRDGHSRLLIDLSETSFIDSTMLGLLLETFRHVHRRRGRLAVLCPDPAIRSIFELVGHNLIFPVDDTLDRALAHLGGPLSSPSQATDGVPVAEGNPPHR